MKIEKPAGFLGIDTGLPPRVVFSKQEVMCLRRAYFILSAADDLILSAGVDEDDYDVRGDLINGWDIAKRLSEAGGFDFEPVLS